jgi:hypothetical protein
MNKHILLFIIFFIMIFGCAYLIGKRLRKGLDDNVDTTIKKMDEYALHQKNLVPFNNLKRTATIYLQD